MRVLTRASRKRAIAIALFTTMAAPLAHGAPDQADTPRIIAESCDLWSNPAMWRAVRDKRPQWEPELGFYSSADDAVTQAHIRMARAHGIAGFQSCWYRAPGNAGQPVVPLYDGFIASVADRAADRDRIAFDIFWDNTNPAGSPAIGIDDFTRHVAAFWLANYLTRPNYLRIAGKPVVAIASATAFAAAMGGIPAAHAALATFRRMAVASGLPGLVMLTANNADPRADDHVARAIGFDAVMAYATPVFTGLLASANPNAADIRDATHSAWSLAIGHAALPVLITASVGYDARLWSTSDFHYLLDPAQWGRLVTDAIRTARSLAPGSPGRAIVLLDAWNEFGEGHFIEPTRASGDRYLTAVAEALHDAQSAPPPALTVTRPPQTP